MAAPILEESKLMMISDVFPLFVHISICEIYIFTMVSNNVKQYIAD